MRADHRAQVPDRLVGCIGEHAFWVLRVVELFPHAKDDLVLVVLLVDKGVFVIDVFNGLVPDELDYDGNSAIQRASILLLLPIGLLLVFGDLFVGAKNRSITSP